MKSRSAPTGEDEFREICRQRGWRFTRQRFAVYSFMRGNRTHPGIDAVLAGVRAAHPHVTRESVFRILCDFAEAGLIARLDHLPTARFDCSTEPHGHFVCSKCGRIDDFGLADGMRISVPIRGARVAFWEIRASGICARCARFASGGIDFKCQEVYTSQ